MDKTPQCQGFQQGGTGEDLFASTAPFYAKYRRPYPESVVSYLVQTYGLNGKGRLLDAGCGTGQVFQVIAKYFEEVIAIDPDHEMVRYAMRAAAEYKLPNVTVLLLRGEDIDERLGTFRMAIFGASFHWMDRRRVAELVYDQLQPGGSLVVLSPRDIYAGTTDWEAEVRTVLAEWLGAERRAGSGVYRAGERHGEALRHTRFREVVETDIYVQEQWPIDQIVGYLFSTSYASPAVLGDKAVEFERAVRERLRRLSPGGLFEKAAEYTVISATRRT